MLKYLVTVLVLAAGFALYVQHERTERYALQAEVSRERSLVDHLRSSAPRQVPSLPAPTAKPVVAPTDAKALAQTTLQYADLEKTMDAERGVLEQRYVDFFAKSGLSAADREHFKTLVVERDNAGLQVQQAARIQGVDLSHGPVLEQAVIQVSDEVNDQLHKLLGDGGYTALQDFERDAFLKLTSHAKAPGTATQ